MKYTKPEGTIIRYTHLHNGNSSNKRRHGKKYVTIARLISVKDQQILSVGVARCSKRDNPSKVIGKDIATGRALKNFLQGRKSRRGEYTKEVRRSEQA